MSSFSALHDLITVGESLFNALAILRDEKTANTGGGTFTSGAWRTRDLNTEFYDSAGIVSLSSNQFTLEPGTYLIEARAPAYFCQRHKAKLRNVTDSSDAIIGSSAYADATSDGAETDSIVRGVVTITSAKTFELQHQCSATSSGNGFGVPTNVSVTEVYSEVRIWRFGRV